MGWSIDLIVKDVEKIFGTAKHRIDVPESNRPYADIHYGREISLVKKRLIAELFPVDYYIKFHPDTIHEEPVEQSIHFPGVSNVGA